MDLAGRSVQLDRWKDSISRRQENLFLSVNKILSIAQSNMAIMAVKAVLWMTLSITSKQMVVSILRLAILIQPRTAIANTNSLMSEQHAQVFFMGFM